jgi:hypothetical protein
MNPQDLAPTSLQSSRIFPWKKRKEKKERKSRTNQVMSWMIPKIANFSLFIAAPAREQAHWELPTPKSWRTRHPCGEHAHWALPMPSHLDRRPAFRISTPNWPGHPQTPKSYHHLGMGNLLVGVGTLETKEKSFIFSFGNSLLSETLLVQLLFEFLDSFQSLFFNFSKLLTL